MREYGSEHPSVVLPDGYFESLRDLGREITYLRSGREALLYVSRNCKRDGEAVILFPAYCCWSMSAPFQKSGWRIVYYKLNEDLTVDLEYLESLLHSCNPSAVLTMNFYGSASTAKAVGRIKAFNSDIVVIEDFSHCTFSIRDIFDVEVDYYVSSIRKSVGVCDGAIILSKAKMDESLISEESGEFSSRRAVAQKMKERYGLSKSQDDKQFFLGEIRACEGVLDEFDAVRPITDLALKQIAQVNGEEIAYARRENMKHLWGLLDGKIEMVPGLERSFGGAPFSLPILVDRRDEVQHQLAQNGVYAPLLWPICDEARSICPVSAKMADRMLSIPIDQRYNWDDMEEISTIVIDSITLSGGGYLTEPQLVIYIFRKNYVGDRIQRGACSGFNVKPVAFAA